MGSCCIQLRRIVTGEPSDDVQTISRHSSAFAQDCHIGPQQTLRDRAVLTMWKPQKNGAFSKATFSTTTHISIISARTVQMLMMLNGREPECRGPLRSHAAGVFSPKSGERPITPVDKSCSSLGTLGEYQEALSPGAGRRSEWCFLSILTERRRLEESGGQET